MCGRFSLITERRDLARELRIPLEAVLEDLEPRYNIAPSQLVPILRRNERMDLFQWGLIPSWAKDPRVGNRMINARGESISTKPSFRDAFRDQRCLVIADGFYEWLGGATSRPKVPHHIRMKSREPFTFAGLWSRWISPARAEVMTCTIITSPSNELVGSIHDRMPVILPAADREAWLDPERNKEELLALLQPYDSAAMEMIPVSRYVNAPANEGAECLAPEREESTQLTLDLPRAPRKPRGK